MDWKNREYEEASPGNSVSHIYIQKSWHIGTQQFTLTPSVRRGCLNAAGISLSIHEDVIYKPMINKLVGHMTHLIFFMLCLPGNVLGRKFMP